MILFKEVFSSLISLIKRGEATMNSRKQSLNQPENLEVSSSSTARRNAINVDMITFKRKFIEPYRAMEEYFLRPSHLQDLPKTHRRSPYFYEDYILVLNRSDVEERALQVWGSMENLKKQKQKRDQAKKVWMQECYEAKKTLRRARRTIIITSITGRHKQLDRETLVVVAAVVMDLLNFLFKLAAWYVTNSSSMLAETVHSAMDTCNELVLYFGMYKSIKQATIDYPYGYSNMRYVGSLIAGVAVFCFGAGVTLLNGVVALVSADNTLQYSYLIYAFISLGFGFLTESVTFVMAVIATWKGAKKSDTSVMHYVLRGEEPGIVVVLLEDLTAVLGLVIAACAASWSLYTHSTTPDEAGSVLIGILLCAVASVVIYSNSTALVGRSIPQAKLDKINKKLEEDIMIRAIYDVKGIDIGNKLVRYKAEIDLDGAELTMLYLDKTDLGQMLKEVKSLETIDELETFMVKHGENIVDSVGREIDRIECKIKTRFPEVRHMDLEIL